MVAAGPGSSPSKQTKQASHPRDRIAHGSRLWIAGLAALFLIALSLRWIYLRQVESVPFFHNLVGDAARYWEWAGQIAGGDIWGHETFYQAPLYPYFLGAVRAAIGDDLFTIRLVQALLGSVSVVILGGAACGLTGSRITGLLAAFLLALSPQAIFYGALIQKSILDLLLSCILIWWVSRIQESCSDPHDRARLDEESTAHPPLATPHPHSRRAPAQAAQFLALGIVLGLLALSRENALLLVVPLALWIAFFFRSLPPSRRLARFGLVLLGSGLILLPVGFRNWRVGGAFAITTVQAGPNFYIGNHEQATGRYVALVPGHESPPFERDDARRLAEAALGRSLNDHDVSRYWFNRSVDFILTHPLAWTRLLATKWMLVWNRYEIPDTEAWVIYAESSPLLRTLSTLLHFGVLVPMAAAGVVYAWPDRRRLACIYAMILTLALATTAFYVLGRYRFPLLPLIIIPAACALRRLPAAFRLTPRLRHRLPALASIAAAAAVAVIVNWPVNPETALNAMAYSNVGAVLAGQDRIDEAVIMFERAVEGSPGAAEPLYNLGLALAFLNRHEEAVKALSRAREIAPTLPDLDYNLAVSLERIGKTQEAVAAYQRALAINPADAQAKAALARLSGTAPES